MPAHSAAVGCDTSKLSRSSRGQIHRSESSRVFCFTADVVLVVTMLTWLELMLVLGSSSTSDGSSAVRRVSMPGKASSKKAITTVMASGSASVGVGSTMTDRPDSWCRTDCFRVVAVLTSRGITAFSCIAWKTASDMIVREFEYQ